MEVSPLEVRPVQTLHHNAPFCSAKTEDRAQLSRQAVLPGRVFLVSLGSGVGGSRRQRVSLSLRNVTTWQTLGRPRCLCWQFAVIPGLGDSGGWLLFSPSDSGWLSCTVSLWRDSREGRGGSTHLEQVSLPVPRPSSTESSSIGTALRGMQCGAFNKPHKLQKKA
ncbi:hypothetical protein AAFF_G00260760 [Aldrovandia affinis]|uniref:Uncharacterized protein n=1 Tax=Aldrovandia affinis TaxID=143900 RepID=A0AAD7RBV7_9TELE|nr:hypothetical protein AAFF_G00260760 [Aldrovandia affinis]